VKSDFLQRALDGAIQDHQAGRLDRAEAAYRYVLRSTPEHADATHLLGCIFFQRGNYAAAVKQIRRAIAIHPSHALAYNNLGMALYELVELEEAEESYRRALRLKPQLAEAHNNLANLLRRTGRLDEAVAHHEQAMSLRPDNALFHGNLIFTLNFKPGIGTAEQQAERRRWNERHAERHRAMLRPHQNSPDPDRKLRIGYVSSHFRHQAAIYACGSVLLNHDTSRFEITYYSDTTKRDEVTKLLRARAARWRETAETSDAALAELIRADEIDILVDLVGHMSGNRLLVFGRKPAPIQVTAWGEPTGTGLWSMDYLLADKVLVPESERPLFAEQIVDLVNYLGYWTPDPLPEPGTLPALIKGHPTFGSFNRLDKIGDEVLSCWARILQHEPTACLILKSVTLSEPREASRVKAALRKDGITADRVKLIGNTSRSDHFAVYHDVDIALDPFPHGGAMTTLEALWMGVPVVTLAGATVAARYAAPTLMAVGLQDYISSSMDGYITRAAAKASDLQSLAVLRSGLRARMTASAIADGERYARDVEAAYLMMWRRWCAERSAA
jgi:protein O-GlcNAc transferase